jgi:hypothetical protein
VTNETGLVTALTRRTTLAGGAAAFGLGGLGIPRASAQPALDRNKVYVQLRGNLDGLDGMWAYTGAYWGKPQGEIAHQLFRVDGFSFNAMTLRDDGGVEQKMIECGFWQDPKTGKLAEEWVNPMNGLTCQPKHFRSSQILSFDADGQQEISDERRAALRHTEGTIMEPVVDGPIVWSQERLIRKFIRPQPEPNMDPLIYTGPVATATSLVTYTANVADLDEGFVPATMHYQSMSSWYPWMRMGQRAGTCSFELMGRKIPSTSEVPERVLAFLEDRQPGFLDNPWA